MDAQREHQGNRANPPSLNPPNITGAPKTFDSIKHFAARAPNARSAPDTSPAPAPPASPRAAHASARTNASSAPSRSNPPSPSPPAPISTPPELHRQSPARSHTHPATTQPTTAPG